MTKQRNRQRHESHSEQQRALSLAVLHAYQQHYGSTTQREDAAADLRMDLATFKAELDNARLMGFDIERKP